MSKDKLNATLENLLQLTAEELLKRVQTGEATHQDISNALKLLKDNHVTVDVKKGDPLDILSQSLPFEEFDTPLYN